MGVKKYTLYYNKKIIIMKLKQYFKISNYATFLQQIIININK